VRVQYPPRNQKKDVDGGLASSPEDRTGSPHSPCSRPAGA
jgi:hypothetical protein